MPRKNSKIKSEKLEVTPKRGRPKKATTVEAKPVKEAVTKTKTKQAAKTKLPGRMQSLQEYLISLQQATKPTLNSLKTYRPSRSVYITAAVAVFALLVYFNKGMLVAATVNGSPISNLELQNRLNQEYREQTLNQMINEKIVMDEARKQGVNVTPIEVNNKITELEKNVGGTQTLDSLLAQQGQTRDSLKNQLVIQLTIEKMYSKDATVSADEVNKFIEQNKDQLQATDTAGQQKEAEDTLKQQKLSQIFQSKFQQLKQSAKVQTF